MADIELIIKLSKEVYDRFGYEYSEENLISKHTNDIILDAICNGTPIPDNATNGDIEQMMFPDAEVNGETDLTVSFSIDSNTAFTKKWWNSPYQKGDKE